MKYLLAQLAFVLSLVFSVWAAATPQTIQRRATVVPHVNGNAVNLNPSGGGTYPRLTNLQDGSILAGFTAFNGATHILTITRSTDGGRSFQAWGTVASGTNDVDNIHIVQLPDGKIVATFRNNDKNGNTYTFYRITASVSSDNGRSWSFLSQVDQRGANGVNGLWVSSVCAWLNCEY